MRPEKAAITGDEDPATLCPAREALSRFYHAFNQRDLELMARNWARSNEVCMANPLGGIERGWPAIRAVYERIFKGPARVYVEFYDYTLHAGGEVFHAAGRERGRLVIGADVLPLAVRTTRVYRRIDGLWRQVHHHGSIDDPELLQRYQALVASSRR